MMTKIFIEKCHVHCVSPEMLSMATRAIRRGRVALGKTLSPSIRLSARLLPLLGKFQKLCWSQQRVSSVCPWKEGAALDKVFPWLMQPCGCVSTDGYKNILAGPAGG